MNYLPLSDSILVSDSAWVALSTAEINSLSVLLSFSSKDTTRPLVSESAIFSFNTNLLPY